MLEAKKGYKKPLIVVVLVVVRGVDGPLVESGRGLVDRELVELLPEDVLMHQTAIEILLLCVVFNGGASVC